jgi:UDP-glucuronate 4-epimerase
MPFSEIHSVDHPVSLYAASKKSNELMAHTYSHLYNLPTTGLRFFTVYGPWGRPDMALFKFTDAIYKDKPIEVFNNGNMIRDFTFIDDIIESLKRVITKIPISNNNFKKKNPKLGSSWAPYKIFNIGNSNPTPLMEYINSIEKAIGKKAKINFKPMQMGDVECTSADTKALEEWINFKPNTSIDFGISKFIDWYRSYYKWS